MYVKEIDNYEELKLWITEHNQAFKNRSSKNIPYKEIKRDDIIIDNNNSILGVYNDAKKLLGGHIFHIA